MSELTLPDDKINDQKIVNKNFILDNSETKIIENSPSKFRLANYKRDVYTAYSLVLLGGRVWSNVKTGETGIEWSVLPTITLKPEDVNSEGIVINIDKIRN